MEQVKYGLACGGKHGVLTNVISFKDISRKLVEDLSIALKGSGDYDLKFTICDGYSSLNQIQMIRDKEARFIINKELLKY